MTDIPKNAPLQTLDAIDGVYTAKIRIFEDERGRFMETFRKEWFPFVNWENIQGNRSDSKAGVLRGLHYHFKQIDYWFVTRGSIRAGLVDLRPDSPTFRVATTVDISEDNIIGLYIPIGVAHGFAALTDCTLNYTVNNYYDGGDEFGVAWNDPELGLDWGVENPNVSDRDLQNPLLQDIPTENLPK